MKAPAVLFAAAIAVSAPAAGQVSQRPVGPPPTRTPSASGLASVTVTREEGGTLRPATAGELARLGRGHRAGPTPEPKVVRLPDGSTMVDLPEAYMTFAVAARRPDGGLDMRCGPSPLKTPVAPRRTTPSPSSTPPLEER